MRQPAGGATAMPYGDVLLQPALYAYLPPTVARRILFALLQ